MGQPTPHARETETGERSSQRFLTDGELIGGSVYTNVIYSFRSYLVMVLLGREKHGNSSLATMADGDDGVAVRRPTPARAWQRDGFLGFGEVEWRASVGI